MSDTWTERLSEYLNEELDGTERASLEAHLDACAECAALLLDLRRVRDRAARLTDEAPPADLWARIESKIRADRAVPIAHARTFGRGLGARFSFSLPQLAAAALAIALVSGGTMYALMRPRAQSRLPASALAPERGVTAIPATDTGMVAARRRVSGPSPQEVAISELKRALAEGRGQLDPATIRALESNLAIIELAIDQAKRALTADPANPYVREHLADTMRRKAELLQRATMLASATD